MSTLLEYAVIICLILNNICIRGIRAHERDHIKFYYYRDTDTYLKANLANLNSLNLDGDGPLFVIIDGFLSNFETSMSQSVKNELIHHRPNGRVVIVDWSHLSGFNVLKLDKHTQLAKFMLVYNGVRSKVGVVGNVTAEFLATLKMKNITDYSKVHLIGYSLGAHIAGITGMNIIEKFSGRITRITGLDPPGQGFPMSSPRKRLDKSDAEFVDIYHSNRYLAGDTEHQVGHVDIYINGGGKGKAQPGCVSENLMNSSICNHAFSWKAWNKCLTEKCEACPCYNLECQNCSGTCKNSITVGMDISLDAAGDYFLKMGPFPSSY